LIEGFETPKAGLGLTFWLSLRRILREGVEFPKPIECCAGRREASRGRNRFVVCSCGVELEQEQGQEQEQEQEEVAPENHCPNLAYDFSGLELL
jgi:hypothetical protein